MAGVICCHCWLVKSDAEINFAIDRVLDVRQAASLRGGGQGMRYTCRICGKEVYLFCDDGRWFLERVAKSVFLHQAAVSLLLARKLYLIIIDLKKLEFSYLKNYSLLITDIEGARAVLTRFNDELDNGLPCWKKLVW